MASRIRLEKARLEASPISAVDLFCGAGGLTHGLLRAGVSVVDDRTREDVPNPGVATQTVRTGPETGTPIKARFVRFTATRLAPRQNDFIFALAELMVLNAPGANLATGAMVKLGGYETWLGTNRLEVEASNKILKLLLEMVGALK